MLMGGMGAQKPFGYRNVMRHVYEGTLGQTRKTPGSKVEISRSDHHKAAGRYTDGRSLLLSVIQSVLSFHSMLKLLSCNERN